MKVITYSSMKDFIDDTLELLLKDEAVNQLLIFTALSKKDLATNDTLHVGKVIDENNEVSLIFLNSPPLTRSSIFNPLTTFTIFIFSKCGSKSCCAKLPEPDK